MFKKCVINKYGSFISYSIIWFQYFWTLNILLFQNTSYIENNGMETWHMYAGRKFLYNYMFTHNINSEDSEQNINGVLVIKHEESW